MRLRAGFDFSVLSCYIEVKWFRTLIMILAFFFRWATNNSALVALLNSKTPGLSWGLGSIRAHKQWFDQGVSSRFPRRADQVIGTAVAGIVIITHPAFSFASRLDRWELVEPEKGWAGQSQAPFSSHLCFCGVLIRSSVRWTPPSLRTLDTLLFPTYKLIFFSFDCALFGWSFHWACLRTVIYPLIISSRLILCYTRWIFLLILVMIIISLMVCFWELSSGKEPNELADFWDITELVLVKSDHVLCFGNCTQ